MKKLLAATLATVLASSMVACGEGGDSGGSDVDKVSLGIAPIAAAAVFQVGIDQGFFKDEGIDLKLLIVQGGAPVLPGVLKGSPEFATTNAITLLTAQDKGIDVKIVANASADKLPPEPGLFGVVAPKGSNIKTTADLVGKSVAVNAINGLGDFTVGEAVRNAGGQPDDVKFLELPFPDMAAALKNGHVDAVWVPEPYLTQLTTAGRGQLVGYTTQESVPGLASYVFTSPKTDPDLVARMTRALNKALDYGEAHTDEVNAAAVDITGVPLEELRKTPMAVLGSDLHEDSLAKLADLLQKRGWTENGSSNVEAVLP